MPFLVDRLLVLLEWDLRLGWGGEPSGASLGLAVKERDLVLDSFSLLVLLP